jgi:hypothetical protein
MADNETTGTGKPIATDKVTYSGDADQNVQLTRIVQVTGAEGSKTVVDLPGDATNGLDVDVTRLPALVAGSANIGDVDVLTVPADPFGANADAASATGSISAKLRFIAATGIPVTGTVTVGSHAVTNAGTFATQSALTAPAATTGGASSMNASSSDGATALTNAYQSLKTSAGSLVGYYIYNPNATAVYVQFWNALTANVTVGTTTPLFMLTIPAASAANLWMAGGVAFGTAIGWSATSTAGGNGAPTTALDATAWYI